MDNLLTALPLVPAAVVVGIYLVRRSAQAREALHNHRMNARSDARLRLRRISKYFR